MNEELTKKMSLLMYHLIKDACRDSFSEYLEYKDISWEEYEIIRNEWINKLGIDKPYI